MVHIARQSIGRRQEHEVCILHGAHAWDSNPYSALRPCLPNYDSTRSPCHSSHLGLLHYTEMFARTRQGRQSSRGTTVQESGCLQDFRLDGGSLDMLHHVQMDTRANEHPDSSGSHILVCAGEQLASPEETETPQACMVS